MLIHKVYDVEVRNIKPDRVFEWRSSCMGIIIEPSWFHARGNIQHQRYML
jgi:hypothetical protein